MRYEKRKGIKNIAFDTTSGITLDNIKKDSKPKKKTNTTRGKKVRLYDWGRVRPLNWKRHCPSGRRWAMIQTWFRFGATDTLKTKIMKDIDFNKMDRFYVWCFSCLMSIREAGFSFWFVVGRVNIKRDSAMAERATEASKRWMSAKWTTRVMLAL